MQLHLTRVLLTIPVAEWLVGWLLGDDVVIDVVGNVATTSPGAAMTVYDFACHCWRVVK